jgi:hypothetical protein
MLIHLLTDLLSAAAILIKSSMLLETKRCTPSDRRIVSFKYFKLSFDKDCMRLMPFTIVFATSNARIEILCPFVVGADTKPPGLKLDMLLLRLSRTSTAFPSPEVLFLPSAKPISET